MDLDNNRGSLGQLVVSVGAAVAAYLQEQYHFDRAAASRLAYEEWSFQSCPPRHGVKISRGQSDGIEDTNFRRSRRSRHSDNRRPRDQGNNRSQLSSTCRRIEHCASAHCRGC